MDDEAIVTFKDCNTVPQIGANVWILDNRYRVFGIDYGFPYPDSKYNTILIDVLVEVAE